MPTIKPNQTPRTAYIAWADLATGNQSVGSAINVATKRAIRFWVRLGRRSGTAFTAGWPNLRFEASPVASGDDWIPVYPYVMPIGANIAITTLSAAALAGATSITVGAATNIAAGDVLFLAGNSASENEVVRVKSVSGSTVTLDDATPLQFAKNSGNQVTDQAETLTLAFACETWLRMRAIIDNAAGGQTVAAQVSYTTYDSDDST